MIKILLIYEDVNMLEFLYNSLFQLNEYKIIKTNGEKAFDKIKKENPNLIILDIDLKQENGIELCKDIKKDSDLKNIIVIFYTDKKEDFIQISCFNAGADDFILNTTGERVVHNRIKACLKRYYQEEKSDVIFINSNFKIFIDEHCVLLNEEKIDFEKKEFELLLLLTSSINKVHTKKEILKIIWSDTYVSDNNVDVLVSKVRKKIGNDYIKNIRSIGYKFIVKSTIKCLSMAIL